jgi:hypothetical protein
LKRNHLAKWRAEEEERHKGSLTQKKKEKETIWQPWSIPERSLEKPLEIGPTARIKWRSPREKQISIVWVNFLNSLE